jgi:ATP-dependent helicase STH1/SNF2
MDNPTPNSSSASNSTTNSTTPQQSNAAGHDFSNTTAPHAVSAHVPGTQAPRGVADPSVIPSGPSPSSSSTRWPPPSFATAASLSSSPAYAPVNALPSSGTTGGLAHRVSVAPRLPLPTAPARYGAGSGASVPCVPTYGNNKSSSVHGNDIRNDERKQVGSNGSNTSSNETYNVGQGWGVPNPLQMATQQSRQYIQQAAVAQQQQQHNQRQQQQHNQHQRTISHAPHPIVTTSSSSGVGVGSTANPKPKVVLTPEAKQALAKAIWSAIRSPTGTVDPKLMEAAVRTGLPKAAIVNAARVAREREAAKRQSMQQANTSTSNLTSNQTSKPKPLAAFPAKPTLAPAISPRPKPIVPPAPPKPTVTTSFAKPAPVNVYTKPVPATTPVPAKPKTPSSAQLQQQQQAKDLRQKAKERAQWKRVQHGIFMLQKEKFLAVPFSVGAMVRSRDTAATLPPPAPLPKRSLSDLYPTIAELQRQLRAQKAAGQPTAKRSPTPLLDPEKFKRIKVEPKKYAKAIDRAARKSRQTTADTLSKQLKDVHKVLNAHQVDFFKFHRQRRTEHAKLLKTIRDVFNKEARKVEKDATHAEKARIAALRANDMTAYSKLLEETRNDRLQYLLDKTEKHFTQISSLLHQERSDDRGDQKGNNSYYASAHLKTEEVRQPSILVGGELKEYQLLGLQWLVSLYNNKLNGILADEMGLGKTIQAISLIAYLMEFKQNLGPYLVIVPLSTLSNWQNEFLKWCPAARLICYKGTPGLRKEIYRDQVRTGHFNVLLTTYEYIIKDKKFLRKIDWQYAIVDEGHRMKNAQSKFAVTLGTQYSTRYRVLLTGTPLMNDLSELWSLLNFLLPTIFNSVETFDQWFSRPFEQFGGGSNTDEGDDLLSNEERILVIHRLHELLRPFMLRRVKSEVLDQLPEKVEKVLRCEMSSWQKELYKQISKKAVADTALMGTDTQAPSRGLNNIVMQLRKVCNHPYLFSPEGYHINDIIVRSSGKMALLDQMLPKLRAAGHRVLMFTQMTAVMTIMEDYFALRGYKSLRLDGSTPAEEREKRMYKFNAPDSPYFVFLLSTRAGGLGLNLTSADTVIIFDSDWNPMMDLQAQDRAHRIGQRSDVSVFRLITYSPVEEKILSRANEKLSVSELVVESGQFNKQGGESDNSLERKRLMEVLLTDFENAQPKAVSEKSAGSEDGEEDDDNNSESSDKEDLNEMLSNNEADYQLYSSIDEQVEREGGTLAPLYISDADVPDWVRYPHQGANDGGFEAPSNFLGDGSRKRKAVMYDDGLTEKQFLRMMEKQAVQEEQQPRKRPKLQKIAPSTVSAAAIPDAEEQAPLRSDSLLTDWTFRKLISCSKSVVALKDPSTKRRLSELFLEKPDPATFPDYYEIVEKPMAINDILRKCRAKIYSNLQEFNDDWTLMFANAKKFNGEDSWVVEDAKALEKELQRVLKKNGFSSEHIPSSKQTTKKKLRIKLSLKDIMKKSGGGD